MHYVKLQKVEIHGVLQCPNCGAEEWLNIKELKRHRKLECMCCGKNIYTHPIKSIDVVYKGESKPRVVEDKDLNEFAVTLARLGMPKSKAKRIVKQNANAYNGNDEEFLNLLLKVKT